MKRILCFDLDNVICTTNKKKNYAKSKPKKNIIKFINNLYETNKYQIYSKFGCIEIITPMPKPKIKA